MKIDIDDEIGMRDDVERVDNNKLNKKGLLFIVGGWVVRSVVGYLDTNRRWNWEAW